MHPEGMTLEAIRKRLSEVSDGPRWFFSRDLEYIDAAAEFGIDPDHFDQLSTDAQGLIVARHRVRGTMRAWENYQTNRKQS